MIRFRASLNGASEAGAPTWVFARGDDRLTIQRVTAKRLIVDSDVEGKRQIDFDSIGALLDFQVDYENRLQADGWALAEFSPERRRGVERRALLRFRDDRRRGRVPSKAV